MCSSVIRNSGNAFLKKIKRIKEKRRGHKASFARPSHKAGFTRLFGR